MKLFATILTFLLNSLLASNTFAQIQFIENKGQWEAAIHYKSEVPSGAFFLEKNGFTVLQNNPDDLQKLQARMHGHADKEGRDVYTLDNNPLVIRSHAYQVKFLNASPNVKIIPDRMVPTYNNYFIGEDASKWKGNCRVFQAVTYQNIYPNIDVRYYNENDQLKYDLIIRPGGRVADIEMEYEGVNDLYVKKKELMIETSVGTVTERSPYSYQYVSSGKKEIDCKYKLEKNRVHFLIDEIDPTVTLVIDPTLIFCSFTGSSADNWGYTATYGPDGSLFAGGIVFGNGYPASPGAFSTSFGGGLNEDPNGPYDMALIKLSANGSNRLFATYVGGRGNEQPHSLFCDPQGNLVMAGRSSSTNYPKTAPLIGPGGLYDIVVTKFNAAGSALIGSLQVGGTSDDGVNIKPKFVSLNLPGGINDGAYETRRNYGDDARSEVILDANNNIYLASCSQSSNFPTSLNAFQRIFGGGIPGGIQQDGVLMKFNANLTSMLFSTYYGGSGNDACFVLSLHPTSGDIYVGGATTSRNLPGNNTNVIYPSYSGGVTDGFVAQFTADGSSVVRFSYMGTLGNDMLYGLQFDKLGYPYIAGATTGSWPVVNAAFSNPGSKQFIAKLKPDLSAFEYSTIFGSPSSSPNISLTALLVDRCQNVYVSGWGGDFNNRRGYPCAGTSGMQVTADALKSVTDGKDFYFFVLEKNAASQLFGSFFGQNEGFDDHVDGGTSRFDANGIIYQGVCANCGNTAGVFFPTTPGAWAQTNPSFGCNQAVVKIEMNFSGVGASVKSTINGVFDTIGCVPLTVRFTDTLAKGKKYIWDFGDGTPRTTTFAPVNSVSHVFNIVGFYRLMLISIDSNTCNISDTAYVRVRVGNNEVRPNFIPSKLGNCQSLAYQFTNTTTATLPIYKPNAFVWDFGDGTLPLRAGLNAVTHTYSAPGTYDVKLTIDDSSFCNVPADTIKKIRLAVNVKAQIKSNANGCVPYRALFENNSIGGLDFTWKFGDGTQVNDNAPTVSHLYSNIGNYTITLIARDSNTCNKTDTTYFNLSVLPNPIAGFSFSPNPGRNNEPINFVNSSSGALTYKWDFGDGSFSNSANPSHLFNASDTFNVCLIAFNAAGCSDTICQPVIAKVIPLLDLPNAFTPGKFGENGSVKVAGFGIEKMDWKIYNRWGQLIFAATNQQQSWDGTYKGSMLPMDVYTYTLDVQFSDGKKLKKTGDITLIR